MNSNIFTSIKNDMDEEMIQSLFKGYAPTRVTVYGDMNILHRRQSILISSSLEISDRGRHITKLVGNAIVGEYFIPMAGDNNTLPIEWALKYGNEAILVTDSEESAEKYFAQCENAVLNHYLTIVNIHTDRTVVKNPKLLLASCMVSLCKAVFIAECSKEHDLTWEVAYQAAARGKPCLLPPERSDSPEEMIMLSAFAGARVMESNEQLYDALEKIYEENGRR